MKRNIHIPCGDYKEDPLIEELMFVEMSEWSSRERARMEKAMDFGELYPATLELLENDSYRIVTDLGAPDAIVAFEFPSFVELKQAAKVIQIATRELVI